jgi:hypothetical protein
MDITFYILMQKRWMYIIKQQKEGQALHKLGGCQIELKEGQALQQNEPMKEDM